MTPFFKVQKLTDTAKIPTKGSEFSAGYDLYSDEDLVITPHTREMISTGISMALHPSTYGRVASRSGLAVKYNIDVCAGIIDSDFLGNVQVVLHNHGEEDFEVTKGMRIAQIIIENISNPEIEVVTSLDQTTRGIGGFGSTGTH